MTEKYCLDRGIPFPRIEVLPEDLEAPRECYLFARAEDPRSPLVLHFPLVNRTFRTHLAPGEGKPGPGPQSPRVVMGYCSESGPLDKKQSLPPGGPSWLLLPGPQHWPWPSPPPPGG